MKAQFSQKGRLEMVLRQGYLTVIPTTWKNPDGSAIDLSGLSAFAQIRNATADDGGAVLADLSETPTADGSISVGALAGTVDVTLEPAATRALSAARPYLFELQLRDGDGKAVRGIAATVTVEAEIAREVV